MSATQKACIIPGPGQAIVLQDRPVPKPGPGQVLVKITATALNPVDNMHRHYPVLISGYPAVLGCDAAGLVEAVGDQVTTLQKGDRVFLQGDFSLDGATFQHYALSRADLVIKTPSNLSDEEASTFSTSIVTAFVILFNNTAFALPTSGPTASDTPIVILGGSGSVGRACIQMAHIAGFSPIITTASRAHAESLKSIGATHVFDRTVPPNTIHGALPSGKPLGLAVDTVSSAETQLFAFEVLTTQPKPPVQGLQLQLVQLPTEKLQAENSARGEAAVKAGIVAGVAHNQPEVFAPFFRVAEKWVAEGKILPAKVQLVDGGLASVSAGLDAVAKGVSGVKLVVNP